MITAELTHYLMLHQQYDQLSEDIRFPLLPFEKTISQGNFNRNTLLKAADDRIYIVRRENQQARETEWPYILAEYDGVGFLDNPQNGFRLRSSAEQCEFVLQLKKQGIPAPNAYYVEEGIQLIEYNNGAVNLAELWEQLDGRALDATQNVLYQLVDAHTKGIVIGDRWGPNELITPEGKVLFVDFDIQIRGPEAKEFELASLLYFVTYFAQTSLPLPPVELKQAYKIFLRHLEHNSLYDLAILNRYISHYAFYFSTAQKYSWRDKEASIHFFTDILNL